MRGERQEHCDSKNYSTNFTVIVERALAGYDFTSQSASSKQLGSHIKRHYKATRSEIVIREGIKIKSYYRLSHQQSTSGVLPEQKRNCVINSVVTAFTCELSSTPPPLDFAWSISNFPYSDNFPCVYRDSFHVEKHERKLLGNFVAKSLISNLMRNVNNSTAAYFVVINHSAEERICLKLSSWASSAVFCEKCVTLAHTRPSS